MKRFNPFHKVSCTYGAPMGRFGGQIDQDLPESHYAARHQGGGQGYDKGGAYWGTPSNVWAVWERGKGNEGVTYVRANTRAQAIRKAKGED